MAVRIQMRRGTSSEWNDADPVLNEGEIGYNSTLGQIKIGDGSSAWSALTYLATESELNSSLANYIEITEKGAGDGVAELDSEKNVLTRASVIFEGATTNGYQTTVTVVDPTDDRTITIPDSTGTVVLSDGSGNVTITGDLTVNGTTTTIDTQNLVVEDKNITLGYGATSDAAVDGGGITLTGATNKTFNWVDSTDSWTSSENLNLASGKTYYKNGTDIKDVSETLTNKTISGTSNTITNIANVSLDNSSITINGTPVSLGGSITIAGDIEGVTASTGLTGGGTSGTVTLAVDTTVVATTNNVLTMSNKTLTSPVVTGLTLNDSSIVFEGSTADDFETTLTVVDPTADRTITIPNITGTIVTTGDTGTVTNTMLAGSIANDKLTNSAITINGTSVSLGGSYTTPGDIEAVSAGTGLTGGGTSGTVTLSVDTTVVATTNNTLTLSNKSISLASNTLSGTISEFNTALSDADFATIAGAETLSNKSISGTSNTLTNIANTSLTNSSVTVNGSSISLGGSATVTAVNPNALTISTGLSGTSYDGSAAVTIAIDSSVATTSGSQTLTNKTLGANNVLGADLGAGTFKITNLGTPTNSTDAATKAYVDAVTEGLHIHPSCVAATTNNIDLSNALEAGDVIDGITLVANDRVLVKNQSTTSENGIYLAVTSGAAVRASDFDTAAEIDGGDFTFVTGGTVNDNTGWVQTEKVTTVGTDPIVFTQFSGAGTYTAGNGLTLTGSQFSINTGVTVDLNTAQTLTNKTIALGSNTVSGSIAEFNTALTDADFATLAGSETFTNKTLTSPIISGLSLSDSSIVFEGSSGDEFETTLTVTNPTADRTITFPDATGTIALQGYLPASLTWGDLKNGKSA